MLRTAAAARRRLSDGQTEGGTTDQSASPGYSSDTNNTEADNKVGTVLVKMILMPFT